MLMVILGAGASYDFEMSHRDLAWRAPLTDELVNESLNTTTLLNEIPDQAASGLVAYLRRERRKSGRDSLESALDRLLGTSSPRDLLAFRMYVQDYLERVSRLGVQEVGSVTNHALLVWTIESWRAVQKNREPIAYVTFNYDTILDQALAGQYGWSPVNRSMTLSLGRTDVGGDQAARDRRHYAAHRPGHAGGHRGPGVRAVLPGRLPAAHREAAWVLMEERLRDAAAFAVRCGELCTPALMEPLAKVARSLEKYADQLLAAK
jgi:hypothetical protein